MKNKIFSRALIGITIFFCVTVVFSVGFFAGQTFSPFSDRFIAGETGVNEDTFKPFIQAWNLLNENYIDQPINPDTLVQGSIRGMLDSLGDPYTSYLDPESYAQQNASLDGEYTGIGAWVDTSGDQFVIIGPMPDSPAEKAGIKPGDVVVRVDDESMEGVEPSAVLEKVLGPVGSTIKLTVEREGESEWLDFILTRAVIAIPSVESEMIEGHIGYIQIFSFANNTYTDLLYALENMIDQGMDNLIIDLRNNPGGLVDSAEDITSIFIEDEIVFIEEWGDGSRIEYRTTQEASVPKIPLYILINQGSASASEITAGALQDHGRAVLIGTTTFGKGLIQNWVPLDGDKGAVRITIAKWLTPKGRQIQDLGLEPDFFVDYTIEDFDADIDPQREKAIELINEKK